MLLLNSGSFTLPAEIIQENMEGKNMLNKKEAVAEIEESNANEIIVSELNNYLSAISELRGAIKSDEGEETDTKHFFFRGQASNQWDIMPGIFRNNMLPHESNLIRSAFVRNPADFRVLPSDFERLTKLQHYGLPTRLLDVTQNPLVALYFACQNNQEIEDGEEGQKLLSPTDGIVLYKRDYCKSYDDLEVRVLSYLAGREFQGDFTLDQLLLELQEKNIYTQKTADECRKSNYKSLIAILQSNYFVISNLNNERLIRQSGAFLICGRYNITLDKANIGKSIIQKANGSVSDEFDQTIFRVPAESKESILDELDFYNINEGSLFPELEHQMTYVRKLQSQKYLPSIGQFAKIDAAEVEDRGIPLVNISDKKVDEIIRNVINKNVNRSLFDECYSAIYDNITIDWYRKEQIQSKMRVTLTNALAKSMDRLAAKIAAQKIVSEIIDSINKSSEDTLTE